MIPRHPLILKILLLLVAAISSITVILIYSSTYLAINQTQQLVLTNLKTNRILVDDASVNSEDEMLLKVIDQMPNLPAGYWKRYQKSGLGWNKTCAKLPGILALEYNNEIWQTLRTSNGTFHLFNAYLDVREPKKPAVRILSVLDRIEPIVVTHCQLWFDNLKTPTVVRVEEYKYIWVKGWGNYKNDIYQPYLIKCPIPKEAPKAPPVAVSLVEKPCDTSTTNIKIVNNKPDAKTGVKDFAVCVKGLVHPYTDISVRLAEWIELLHLLGADKVFFYDLATHPNITKLLRYYQDLGMVEVTPLKLPGHMPNAPSLQNFFLKKKIIHKRQNELIPYNDCFYKHMYQYRYIVLLDTDEVIMPKKHHNWKEMMDYLEIVAKNKIKERSSYHAQNVYFLDDLLNSHGWFADFPRYFHMLQHVYRSKNFTRPGNYIKSFFNTRKVIALHNHYPLACIGGCYAHSIDKEIAQLQHYRRDCVNDLKKVCDNFRNDSVADFTIWKYKKELIARVNKTLQHLGYFSQYNIVEDK